MGAEVIVVFRTRAELDEEQLERLTRVIEDEFEDGIVLTIEQEEV